MFIRPVNSLNVNTNYFLPGEVGGDHAFKFGGYWRDTYSESISHTGGLRDGALPDRGRRTTAQHLRATGDAAGLRRGADARRPHAS